MSVVMPTGAHLSFHALEAKKAEEAKNTTAPEALANSFAKAFADARNYQDQSVEATEKFASGDTGMGIHEVMIASEKANIAVRYATTLKNKCVEAYKELMNTQV